MLHRIFVLLSTCCCTFITAQYHDLTLTAGPGGTTAPSGTVSVKRGGKIDNGGMVIAAYPDSGYVFDRWTVQSGTETSWSGDVSQLAITYIAIESNATVQAHFSPRGTVYDIDSSTRQYTYDIHDNDEIRNNRPGVLFRFTAPSAGTYVVVVENSEPTPKNLYYYGRDSTFVQYTGNAGNDTLTWFVKAVAGGERHYFSLWLNFYDESLLDNSFSIRYETIAELTLEHIGDGTTYPSEHVPMPVRLGIVDTVRAYSNSYKVSVFDHWEVVSGEVTIHAPSKENTPLTVNSRKATVRAVFSMNPADTLIILSDGNGGVLLPDTIFIVKGEKTRITAVPRSSYQFASWSVVEGNAVFTSPGSESTDVRVPEGRAVVRADFIRDARSRPEIAITDITISGHPHICATVSVTDSVGSSITGLDSSFFTVHEDGTVQPFRLTTVAEAGGISVCLVIDKGSYLMEGRFEEIILAARTYIASMRAEDRCAIVAYDHRGYLIQEMTSDTVALNSALNGLISVGGSIPDSGITLGVGQLIDEIQPRVIVMYTGITPMWSGNEWATLDSVNNNEVTIYRIITGRRNDPPGTIVPDEAGGYTVDGLNVGKQAEFAQEIRRNIGSRYILCYTTPDTIFNGDIHTEVISVSMNGTTARDTAYWDESNRPPVITLTPATKALVDTLQPADSSLALTAEIVDDGTITDARLFHRTTGGNGGYTELQLTLQAGNIFGVTLPADIVHAPGVDFYILATDEKGLGGKSPAQLRPGADPWVIFVGDGTDVSPVITLTSATRALFTARQPENTMVPISAVITDDGTVTGATLLYRTSGNNGDFTSVTMRRQTGNTFRGEVPAEAVVAPGIEFYLQATDDAGNTTTSPVLPADDPWTIPVGTEQVYTGLAVKEAFCYADNGVGSVNRVEMYYYTSLDTGTLPDSLQLCWPDTTQCRVVRKNAVLHDPSDATHLTVTLPQPFPDGFTGYTGWNGHLGSAWHRDSASPDLKTVTVPFALGDRVGPLIAGAVLIERQDAGDDTLILDFTEYVDYTAVNGQCLTLLKNSGGGTWSEYPLTVVAAIPDADSRSVIAVIPFAGEASAPKVGDSLRITAAGPIVDKFGNRAHQLNRPVVLSVKRNPPKIVQAVYLDRNADGMVDTVRIVFNRKVSFAAMQIEIVWNGMMETVAAEEYRRVGNGIGGDTVEVGMASLFPSPDLLKNRTSGTMRLSVAFTDYESGNMVEVPVRDGAAPVLTALRYHAGRYLSNNRYAADTLFAQFSEPLAHAPSAGEPLLFQMNNGVRYRLALNNPTSVFIDTAANNTWEPYYRFIVVNSTIPAVGDSGCINTGIPGNIIDAGENEQINDNNRRVALYIRRQPLHLQIQAGPNPFRPPAAGARHDGFIIRINDGKKKSTGTEYWVRAAVYDKTGNVIRCFPDDVLNNPAFVAWCGRTDGKIVKSGSEQYLVTADSSRIDWDGTNRRGRIVGDGTYCAIVHIFTATKGSPAVEYPPERLLIGVKRFR